MRKFTLMILAAGYGTRMLSLTKNKPKPLLKIKKNTLLENTLVFFEKLGCEKFIINTHFLHEQIDIFIKKKFPKKNIILNHEINILNTGGGIKNSIKYFNNKNIVVTNADIFWEENNKEDVIDFIKDIDDIQACSILLLKNINAIGLNKDKGDFILENSLIERWRNNNPILYYSGLQIINPKIFNLTKKEKFSMNLIWDKLINKRKLTGKIMKSQWIHVGDINTINYINNFF